MLYGIVQFKKCDPGAKCGITYYIMYFKFAHMQKYGFSIFGIFVDQGKNAYTCYRLIHGSACHQK